jgi:FKBP-type peptidyl-prolyl cis-trans isomerase
MNPMNMKKTILYLSLAALVLAGCAKDPKKGVNDANKRYIEAWIQVNHPDAVRTGLGAYILEDTPGTGPSVSSADSYPYVRVNYTIRTLDGTVQTTTEEALSKRLGTYTANKSKNPYYGPMVWNRSNDNLVAGLEETVSTMSVGGHRTVVLPGWLMGVDANTNMSLRYKTAEEYLEKVQGGTPVIYELTLTDAFSDVMKWQIDSVGRYLAGQFPGKSVADSTKKGFYYIRTGAPSSEVKFKNDTTIYINYIGRRLDGQVFDTSIADTAKYYGIYSASRTYGACKIGWYSSDQDYTNITMTLPGASSSSSVINGFSLGLDQMHPHEKGTAVFISNWGYGVNGSGVSIPGYSPLRFDFEIVDKPAE